jgi:hypothetical protein
LLRSSASADSARNASASFFCAVVEHGQLLGTGALLVFESLAQSGRLDAGIRHGRCSVVHAGFVLPLQVGNARVIVPAAAWPARFVLPLQLAGAGSRSCSWRCSSAARASGAGEHELRAQRHADHERADGGAGQDPHGTVMADSPVVSLSVSGPGGLCGARPPGRRRRGRPCALPVQDVGLRS